MRNHPLSIGEVVFDLNWNYFGVITELTDGHAKIDMNGHATYPKPIRDGWCKDENRMNRMMMDVDIREEDRVWETDDLDALYQVAWGVKDARTENIVCYEHVEFEDMFPYYSPYLEENLYEFEVVFC